jgi:hypothetical protein
MLEKETSTLLETRKDTSHLKMEKERNNSHQKMEKGHLR